MTPCLLYYTPITFIPHRTPADIRNLNNDPVRISYEGEGAFEKNNDKTADGFLIFHTDLHFLLQQYPGSRVLPVLLV